MKAYLGVDVGTYESKGVLVDREGRVLASAARSHELIVPRAGWAEHRAEESSLTSCAQPTRPTCRRAAMSRTSKLLNMPGTQRNRSRGSCGSVRLGGATG